MKGGIPLPQWRGLPYAFANQSHVPKGRLNTATWKQSLFERIVPKEYVGADLRCVAMPLGGIGTGSIALCGDGSLRQWQVVNQVNHVGYVPYSFFAIWARRQGKQPIALALQTDDFLIERDFEPVPSVSDHMVPDSMARWMASVPTVMETRFQGEYPIARVSYHDEDLPIDIRLDATSPFVPFNAAESGVPGILFRFTLRNRTTSPVAASLMGSLQNFVGWDGESLIGDVRNPGFGGNFNRLHRTPGRVTLEMINSRLPADHPSWGELALVALADDVTALPQWDDFDLMWHEFERDGTFGVGAGTEPSSRWRTWNGSLSSRVKLEPGEEKQVGFVLAWYFPNRYVNWRQPVPVPGEEKSKFWIGNFYNHFGSVMSVVNHLDGGQADIWEQAERFKDTLYKGSQPCWFLDAVSANIVPARTNICLRTEAGAFHGFEGGGGASTAGWCAVGGCCALDCTHVWNYEMTISRLWPSLDQSMRETDWLLNQNAKGYLPHRTPLPDYLPRLWDVEIGGPENPALDGLFGGVLKTYREYLTTGERSFLETMAPHVFSAVDYVMETQDTEGDGVLKGEQPNTYDIHLYGPNTFIGTLYLAALLAAGQIADRFGDPVRASKYRARFELGTVGYDNTCYTGEYYRQIVDLREHVKYQFGDGCMSDQLLGQWWAHLLGLGYVLPKDHVRNALVSIFKYNFRDSFVDFPQEPRVFASPHDRGLLIATYPEGNRPDVPLLYSDEVWTGVEYEVASLMLYEGMADEGLSIVRAVRDRYDGNERNPWNEVECGDHYVRAMSSWSLLDLSAGLVYDAERRSLRVGPRWQEDDFAGFFVAGYSYGLIMQKRNEGELFLDVDVRYGNLAISELRVLCPGEETSGTVSWNGEALSATFVREGDEVVVQLPATMTLAMEQTVRVSLNRRTG